MHNCLLCLGRKEEFETMIVALEKCQKSLTEYLLHKRALFPRFNFISDDELLGILGSSDPRVIQEHVGKMFDNLDKFRFISDNKDRLIVTALISYEREIMEFRNFVAVEDKIEIWLSLAVEEMKRSNRYLTKKAVYNYGKVCLCGNIWITDLFNREIEFFNIHFLTAFFFFTVSSRSIHFILISCYDMKILLGAKTKNWMDVGIPRNDSTRS